MFSISFVTNYIIENINIFSTHKCSFQQNAPNKLRENGKNLPGNTIQYNTIMVSVQSLYSRTDPDQLMYAIGPPGLGPGTPDTIN